MLQKNNEYTGTVVALGSEGEGIINVDGTTAFVPLCLTGESVSFKVLKAKDNIAYGKLTEVHTLSADRAHPVCPVYEKCGGCQLQHMSYSAQLSFKKAAVANSLKKIGGINFPVSDVVPSDKQYNYRNKLALPIGKNAEGGNALGFYAPRSHRIVAIEECPLQQEWTKGVIAAVYEFMRTEKVEAYDEVTKKGILRQVVGREVKGKYIITIVATKKINLEPLRILLEKQLKKFTLLLNINSTDGNVIFGKQWHIVYGEGFFVGEDEGIKYKAGANTFLQVNDDVRTKLYRQVVAEVANKNVVALDLYSGGGMLTAMLAKNCKAAYGIEIVAEAVACADELKEMNGLGDKMFNICGAVEDNIAKVFAQTCGAERVIVCDPPRKGMERSVVKAIRQSGADKVVLVSCNPATLARDLGLLCGTLCEDDKEQIVKTYLQSDSAVSSDIVSDKDVAVDTSSDTISDGVVTEDVTFDNENSEKSLAGSDYEILSIVPFDMFPQTKHCEVVVALRRK